MVGRPPIPPEQLARLVHPRERIYLALLIAAGIAIYLFAIRVITVSSSAFEEATKQLDPAAASKSAASPGWLMGTYVAIAAIFYFIVHGRFVGHLRGNGVRVTERQFPVVNRLVEQHAATLGLTPTPPVYIVQAGGILNAFAIRFFSRAFVVLYSDMVALAQERGEGALGFVVAHELAHIRRGHLRFRWLKFPGYFVPYLGKAYSRACEYTCDRFSAECDPQDAVSGLLVLAAGRSLYRDVDARLYAQQVESEDSFWVRRAEIASTHPRTPKRVEALLRAGIPLPAGPG